MKLRRVLAILAFVAVAILPVAAAPAVVTGNVYGEAITDFANHVGAYGTINVYINASPDDWNTLYVDIGRQLVSYVSPDVVAASTGNMDIENVAILYAYGKSNVAKFFNLDKSLIANLYAGYYYSLTGNYENTGMFDTWVRVRQGTNGNGNPDWFMQAELGLPGIATLKAAVRPLNYQADVQGTTTLYNNTRQLAFGFTNDWLLLAYTNQTIPNLGTFDAEVAYYANGQLDSVTKDPLLDKGIILVDGDVQLTMGLLKVTCGLGFEYNLATAAKATLLATDSPFDYGVTLRGTYYLDDKKTTFAGAGFGIKGYPQATVSGYAFRSIEIDAFCTPIALIDIKACAEIDMADGSTVASSVIWNGSAPGLRSLDTAVCFNIGTSLDLYVGFLYNNTVNNGADGTFYDASTFFTAKYDAVAKKYTNTYYSGPYIKFYWVF